MIIYYPIFIFISSQSAGTIDAHAFFDCTGLTKLTIPNSVRHIGEDAFFRCTGLTKLAIPNSVAHTGVAAFRQCTGLTELAIPNSVTHIDEDAFSGCTGLTELAIPNFVTHIGVSAFSGCTGLTMLTIPNSVMNIGDHAFRECQGLTELVIPNSVTHIGERAFFDCKGLTKLTIPSSVRHIGEDAFYNGHNIKVILIDAPNDIEHQRICSLLPSAARKLVIPLGFYQQIKEAQEQELYAVKAFRGDSFSDELPSALTNQFEQWLGHLHDVIDRVPLPRRPEELQSYKQTLQGELSRFGQEQENRLDLMRAKEQETLAERQRLRAISKLQQVIESTEKAIAVLGKKPGFFESNAENMAKSVARIAVAKKLIEWLDNDKTVSFTEEEVKVITPESSIGIILRNNSIDSAALPKAASPQSP